MRKPAALHPVGMRREHACGTSAGSRRCEVAGDDPEAEGAHDDIRDYWTDELLAAHGVSIEFHPATATIGESTLAAYAQARVRNARRRQSATRNALLVLLHQCVPGFCLPNGIAQD